MNLITKDSIEESSLEDFITDYFKKGSPTTYIKATGRLQCMRGARRSFGDVVRLCSSYFPCSEKEIAAILVSLWEKNFIQALFCNTTRKVVFFKQENHWSYDEIIHPTTFDIQNPVNVRQSCVNSGYNKPLTVGKDGYSFVDIYNLAKVK